MSSPDVLAGMLQASLGGYAGGAAAALLEARPELRQRIGPGALDLFAQHFEERLGELAAALAFERPQLFADGYGWTRTAYEARGATLEQPRLALAVLEEQLDDRLPPGSGTILTPYFEAARAVLEAPSAAVEPLTAGEPLTLELLERTLEGDSRGASRLLLDAWHGGRPVVELFERVIVPAQAEIGELWHRGEINVAEEHVATLTTQKAIAVLAAHVEPAPATGRTVIVSAVTGDAHDLGARLIAELFELAGWRSVALGADVPRLDLLQALEAFAADLLVLSATLARHLLVIRSAITAVRERSARPEIAILVGGRAFRPVPELWRAVGATGSAASLGQAVEMGERLVSGD